MKLRSIRIRNFRSIVDLTLNLWDFNTIIGRNSSGKSNILRAIHFFFTASPKALDRKDICDFGDDDGTWIECTFAKLTKHEEAQIPEKYVLHDDKLCIRRSLEESDGKLSAVLRGIEEVPEEDWLQEGFPRYNDSKVWASLNIDPFDYASPSRSGKVTKEVFSEFRREYIKAHRSELSFARRLSTSEFKGRQSTAASVLPTVTFVPASGDVAGAIVGKQSAMLNTIVSALVKGAEDQPEYRKAHESLRAAADFINPSDRRLPLLGEIERMIEQQLRSWEGVKCTLRTHVDDLSKILTDGLDFMVDDGSDTDLIHKGEGIQRQILFQVFRLYADYRAQRKIFASSGIDEQIFERSHIIIFEEPELCLHPQAQESFCDDLLAVSEKDQVVLSTHSSHLVRLENADGMIILRRTGLRGSTQAFTADESWMSSPGDRAKLKEINLWNSDIARIFFADKIVILEGPEDYIYVMKTAEDHANCLDRRVTVVHVGGNNNIPILQRVLNGFGIPYTAVYDKDPGNPNTKRTVAKIVNLAKDNKQTSPQTNIDEYEPDLPSVCGNEGVSGDKVYAAMRFFDSNSPRPEFIGRVRTLFSLRIGDH